MVNETTAVKYDFSDVLAFCPVGNQFADLHRRDHVRAIGLVVRELLFGRIHRSDGLSDFVVNDLCVNMQPRKMD